MSEGELSNVLTLILTLILLTPPHSIPSTLWGNVRGDLSTVQGELTVSQRATPRRRESLSGECYVYNSTWIVSDTPVV